MGVLPSQAMARQSSRTKRRILAALLALGVALAAVPAAAQSEARSGADRALGIGIDVVLVRPMRALAVVGGAVLFIPAAIMCSPGGKNAIGQAYDKLIGQPVEQAFVKPLGEF